MMGKRPTREELERDTQRWMRILSRAARDKRPWVEDELLR